MAPAVDRSALHLRYRASGADRGQPLELPLRRLRQQDVIDDHTRPDRHIGRLGNSAHWRGRCRCTGCRRRPGCGRRRSWIAGSSRIRRRSSNRRARGRALGCRKGRLREPSVAPTTRARSRSTTEFYRQESGGTSQTRSPTGTAPARRRTSPATTSPRSRWRTPTRPAVDHGRPIYRQIRSGRS
jgi:hypothetical protein